ncbi:MAG: ABC-2 type transport system permease protein, partial [Halieaceae bacterium]
SELGIGSADLRPRKAEISAMGRADDMFRFYEVDNPAQLALGRFDLAFVVVYLMPLLILGLTYSVLSADRESGALGLLLAQPVTAGQVAWARIGLRSAIVTTAVVAGTLLGWATLAPEPASPQAWPRLLMWSGVVVIYAAFWASLAALVAARNRGSDNNALVLLIAWVTITLLLPAVVSITAQTLNPTPSRMEYITTARAVENEANANGQQLLKGYLMDHPEIEAVTNSSVAPFVKTFVLVQQQVEAATAPITQAFEAKLEAQQRVASALAYLSPASLTQRALAALAGTGLQRQRRFEKDAHDLRRTWFKAVEVPLIAGRRLSADELSRLPRPEFVETPVATVMRATGLPLLLILIYTGLVGWLAVRVFRRFSMGS